MLILFNVSRKARERRRGNAQRSIEIDIGVAIVIRIEIDAINRNRFANTHFDLLAEEFFKFTHRAALARQKHGRDFARAHDFDARDFLHVEHELHASHHVARNGVRHTNLAVTAAMRAIHVVRLAQTWTHALARHLNDAEFTDLSDRRFRTILRKILLETVFDIASMLRHAHIDEIAHDHAAEIAQTNLSCDLIDRFLVRLIRVGLAVARAA